MIHVEDPHDSDSAKIAYTLTNTAPITCGRCGRERKTFVEVGPNIRVLSREQMRGWFELEPGDWRCGCILKQQPEGDL